MKIQEALGVVKSRKTKEFRSNSDNIALLAYAVDVLVNFTEKVLGEPSEAMVEATITSFNDNGKLALVSHAKAYVNQARKEVEGE